MRIRRKNLIILIGIVLIISFLLPIASCNKKNTANARKKYVYKDSPWYEGELINVDLSLDANRKVDYLKTSFAGADEKYIVLFSDGSYKVNNWNQVSHMKFTSEDIDRLERIVLSCSKSDTEDSAINLILIEEMPAYFLGQKDLHSVVKIAQNRAQKVIDER